MTKEEFKAKAKQSIDDLFSQYEKLEEKKEQASGEAKREYHQQIENVKAQKEKLQSKYRELENASEEEWEQAKSAFSDASDSFKEGFYRLKEWMS